MGKTEKSYKEKVLIELSQYDLEKGGIYLNAYLLRDFATRVHLKGGSNLNLLKSDCLDEINIGLINLNRPEIKLTDVNFYC